MERSGVVALAGTSGVRGSGQNPDLEIGRFKGNLTDVLAAAVSQKCSSGPIGHYTENQPMKRWHGGRIRF